MTQEKKNLVPLIQNMGTSKTIKRTDVISLRNAYNNYVSSLANQLYCLRKPKDNKNPTQKELDEEADRARATLADILKRLPLT